VAAPARPCRAAKPAIFILYGEPWLGAAAPLSLVLIAQVIAVGFGMNWELFVLKDETARQTRIEGVRGGLGLTAFTIGASISLTAARRSGGSSIVSPASCSIIRI
jgi:hypothetical protein